MNLAGRRIHNQQRRIWLPFGATVFAVQLLAIGLLCRSTMNAQAVPAGAPGTPGEPGVAAGLVEERPLTSYLYGRSGFRINAISVSGSYYSMSLPGTLFQTSALFNDDVLLSGSISMSLSHVGARSNVAIHYSPSYMTYARNHQWDSWAHALTFNADRKLTNKWTLAGSLTGSYSTLEQIVFMPTTLQTAVGLPANFEEFANSLLRSPIGNDRIAGMLASTPVVDDPSRMLLFGNSFVSAAGSVSLSYARSSRMNWTMTAGGVRTQPISAGRWSAVANRGLLAQTTSGNVGVNLAYSLSPRTQIGVNAMADRIVSGYQDAYRSNASLFIGRKMGRRWFLQGAGGGGHIQPVRQLYQLPTGFQYQASGSLGLRTYSHTFLWSGGRAFGDSYGIGAGSTLNASAAWNWADPRRSWGINASATQQWMQQRAPGNLRSFQGAAGLSRRLGGGMVCSVEYSYTTAAGLSQLLGRSLEQHGVRGSLTWAPRRIETGNR